MFKYDKLFKLMESQNVTSYTLTKKNRVVSGSAFPRMRSGKDIDFITLGKLCEYFGCQPNDLIEYVPNEKAS